MAIQFALNHPDMVDKLVLMAPGGLEQRETYMKMDGIRAMMKSFFAPGGITRESMIRVFEHQLYSAIHLTPEIIDERMAIAPLQPKRVLSTMHVPWLTPELGRLGCPVFALWGQNDRFCPVSGAHTIVQHVDHARVTILSRCGHWVMVEYESLFNRLCVDFLRNG